MTGPRRYLLRMILFLVVAIIATAVLFSPLARAFGANPLLNGLILGVMFFGVAYIFRQVIMIYPEVAWLEAFRSDQPGLSIRAEPSLLGPVAAMLRDRQGRLSLSATATRSILDSVNARLDETRNQQREHVLRAIFVEQLQQLKGFVAVLEQMAAVGVEALARTAEHQIGELGILELLDAREDRALGAVAVAGLHPLAQPAGEGVVIVAFAVKGLTITPRH